MSWWQRSYRHNEMKKSGHVRGIPARTDGEWDGVPGITSSMSSDVGASLCPSILFRVCSFPAISLLSYTLASYPFPSPRLRGVVYIRLLSEQQWCDKQHTGIQGSTNNRQWRTYCAGPRPSIHLTSQSPNMLCQLIALAVIKAE